MKAIVYALVLAAFAVGALLAPAAETAGIWINVPFVTQVKDGCGSASMAMVMQYWDGKEGKAITSVADPQEIQDKLYSRKEKGIEASAMRRYFEEAGYQTFAFEGEWSDLKHHLEEGRPLIVAIKASGARGPLHYVVVVGLDWDRGYIFVNDPDQQKMLRISREGFESEWNGGGNWILLAVPRD